MLTRVPLPSDKVKMGAAASSAAHKGEAPATPRERVISRSIDRELAKERIEMANTFKILLLGSCVMFIPFVIPIIFQVAQRVERRLFSSR